MWASNSANSTISLRHCIFRATLASSVNLVVGAGWFRRPKKRLRKLQMSRKPCMIKKRSRDIIILIVITLYTTLCVEMQFLHQYSTGCNTGTARWKNFFQSHTVEQHKSY